MDGIDDGLAVVFRDVALDIVFMDLTDSVLPLQGVVEQLGLNMERTDYPGSRRATLQVMGTKDEPITLEGWLRDSQIGVRGGAYTRWVEMKNLLQTQRYLELGWGEYIVKRGMITGVSADWQRASDIKYTITFEPTEDMALGTLTEEFAPVESQWDLSEALATVQRRVFNARLRQGFLAQYQLLVTVLPPGDNIGQVPFLDPLTPR